MNEFKTFHPVVNFTYFAFVTAFSMLLMHPIALAISFVCGFTYSIMCGGRGAIKTNLIYMLPVMIMSAVVNPLFNHEGQTILTYFRNGNPLTLESIVYGAAAAVMLVSVICHFSCFNRVITSDKLMYLFGRIIPSLSLVISMSLRFVPRFAEQVKIINEAQAMLGKKSDSGILYKLRRGIRVMSITVTWALENAADTADSMKSRGYGERFRTAFSIYRFDRRDAITLCIILLFGLWLVYAYIMKYMYFVYFPTFATSGDVYTVISLIVYFMLCSVPIIIEIKGAVKWKATRLKI